MSDQLKERCIYCGSDVYYSGSKTLIKCGMCGHTLVVAKFKNEIARMQEAAEKGEKAQKALDKAKQEKQAADDRLFRALSALEHLEDISTIQKTLADDQKVQSACRDLLENMQDGMAQDHKSIFEILQIISGEQQDAGSRLSVIRDLAEKMAASQEDMLGRVALQGEIITRLYAMEMDAEKRQALAGDFMLRIQQMTEEDMKCLKRIEYAAGSLLDSQKEISDKIDGLQIKADRTQKTLEEFRSQWKESQLQEIRQLFHQAENFQRDWRFDKAEEYYQKVVTKGGGDAEVYWRLLMCHYCVAYQEDDDGKLKPFILNPDLTDPDQMSIRRELADHIQPHQREAYLGELRIIDGILNKYRRIRDQVQFDVFISVKQSRDGRYTADSDVASDLYDFLTENNLRVFNSRRTTIPAGQDFEPYIISALMSSKVLIVVGSTPENMNAQWVKNEWTRFNWLQRREKKNNGKTERVMFCYLAGGMQPHKIPKALNPDKQAIVDGVKAYTKLKDSLRPIFEERIKAEAGSENHAAQNNHTEGQYYRVINQMTAWLFQGKYEKVQARYDELTEEGAFLTHARIHLAVLCAEKQVPEIDDIVRSRLDLRNEPYFKLAMKLCHDKEEKDWLLGLLEKNRTWIEQTGTQETKKEQPVQKRRTPVKEKAKTEIKAKQAMNAPQKSAEEMYYEKGLQAVKQGDQKSAFDAFSLAAQMDYAPALCSLGSIYERGFGTDKDLKLAEQCYEKAALLGYSEGETALRKLRENLDMARLQKEAEVIYNKGLELDAQKKYTQAAQQYRKAADMGYALAQNNLGVCYMKGAGVSMDKAEAVKWYKKAARQGLAVAQSNLGYCCENGIGLVKDLEEAVRWYTKAAEQGHATAQKNLGRCLDQGIGVPADYAQAFKWHIKAAEQGNAQAQYNAGLSYFYGRGFARNLAQAVSWFRKAAGQGEVHAQYMLGQCYENGTGVAKDLKQAAQWYQKAADQGDQLSSERLNILTELLKKEAEKKEKEQETGAEELFLKGLDAAKHNNFSAAVMHYRKAAEMGHAGACNNLGLCYERGTGVAKNMKTALTWIEKGARRGDAQAQYNMGWYCENGVGTAKKMDMAAEWYRRAAEGGHAEAQNSIGLCFDRGTGVPVNRAEALKWFKKAAEQGHAWGQNNYGLYLRAGLGAAKNEKEAVIWIRKAADQGIADSQFRLGSCYEYGTGVPQDKAEAAKWYRKAAEQGHTDAQNSLGLCYDQGKGVQANKTEALKWFKKAAEQGHDWGQYNYGLYLIHGYGTSKNAEEAVKWYRKAAEQGHANAQNNLGVCYRNGDGVKKDEEEAVRWYKKAADQGLAIAQNNLGECLEKGIGCVQNKESAREWFEKAAAQGYESAKKNLERLTKKKKWF